MMIAERGSLDAPDVDGPLGLGGPASPVMDSAPDTRRDQRPLGPLHEKRGTRRLTILSG
jgi:hypothetical protein